MAGGENTPSCVGVLHYDRLEWQRTLMLLKTTPDVAYEIVLEDFVNVWCVKGLIGILSNLVITWKDRPRMAVIS